MKQINVKLNQDYKQFKKGFSCELQGDLIIISGVNGSGKSQLIDILKKENNDDLRKRYIDSDIKINDKNIDKILISSHSFKDNINIKNIILPEPKNNLWHKEKAWNTFCDYPKWRKQTVEYSKWCK